ncbi:MAG: 16S rRNA (guanine(527)-N(7))-methyltransferase RsmG [Epsilonproteobacteria bacterium]|nr:MAG: 16S rRNA (guanine(527)-N(7))-methyltransferase RsmG [Campylobacterota bacterium]
MTNLKNSLRDVGLSFDDDFFEKIKIFKTILKQWGATHNLTSSLDDIFIEKNIVDSLYVLKFLKQFDSFADIGTGAGYPGLILAIAKPDTKCYLIEPNRKKSAFLGFVVASLKLKNTKIISKKVELCNDIKPQLVFSRAVTNVKELLKISSNISNKNTTHLLYKGSNYKDEIEGINKNIKVIDGLNHRRYVVLKQI